MASLYDWMKNPKSRYVPISTLQFRQFGHPPGIIDQNIQAWSAPKTGTRVIPSQRYSQFQDLPGYASLTVRDQPLL